MKIRKTAGAIIAAAVVLSVSLASTEAFAFRMIQNSGVGRFTFGSAVACNATGGFAHWNNANINFAHNTANQGAGKGTALSNAAASWTGVSGASHNVSVSGNTNAGFVTDGTNTLLWANGNGCTGGCLAITALVLSGGQVITETDVSFNNAFNWNTNGSDYDTEAIAAHELGHCMGIHHTESSKHKGRPTMYANYFGTGGRTLENDDKIALNCAFTRYPPAGASMVASGVEEFGLKTGAASDLRLVARPREGGAIIRYALKSPGNIRIDVFDVAGRKIATPVDGFQAAGEHETAWDGISSYGRSVSGFYFARMSTSEGRVTATVPLAE